MRLLPPVLLTLATIAFVLGVSLPLMRVERLFFFSEEPSLLAIVAGLWSGGDRMLAAVVALASIALPVAKLGVLWMAVGAGMARSARAPAWLQALSRWSMLDVVLVALVIFAAKTSGLATAVTQAGLWFFALSVALTAVVSALLKRVPRPVQ